ncbi:hypothetical protein [Caulobacter sp. Root655]|uniref:hypothetical protein n=1 Tax=Caulobacter sp. Root655 TaxID=1736578 RepID=UPI000AE7BE58|nr:hypothetical protein [Caulobacter sp. Root655]
MSDPKPETEVEAPREDLEEQLEEGLEDSFPASDPPSAARRHRAPPTETDKPA